MKKLLVLGLVFGGLAVMSSCKKDYTCTYDLLGAEFVQDYPDLDKDQADAAEAGCKLLSGTWATK